jgi:hypothetical protein
MTATRSSTRLRTIRALAALVFAVFAVLAASCQHAATPGTQTVPPAMTSPATNTQHSF